MSKQDKYKKAVYSEKDEVKKKALQGKVDKLGKKIERLGKLASKKYLPRKRKKKSSSKKKKTESK